MTRQLDVMENIMETKEREIKEKEIIPLDEEGKTLAEHKRFTLDMVGTPVDPLR